jgi:hypothetical protein
MPTVYRIRCDACGRGPDAHEGVAGYVATDGKSSGVVLPDGYLAVRLDSGVFVALPHPLEESTLSAQGFTWRQASKEGRMHRMTYKVCQRCGLLHEERQLHDGRAGCMPAVAVGIAIFVFIKFAVHRSWSLALFVGYLGMIAGWFLVMLGTMFRWKKQNSTTKLRDCAACHATELITFERAVGKLLPCPYCHTTNMRYTCAGLS